MDSSDQVLGLPKRSESQQAVKGSVSDKTDLELSEEGDSDDCRSVGSCHSDNDVGNDDDKSESSEVFAEDKPTPSDNANDEFVASIVQKQVKDAKPINNLETATHDLHQLETDGVGQEKISKDLRNPKLSRAIISEEVQSKNVNLLDEQTEPSSNSREKPGESVKQPRHSSAAVLVPNGRLPQMEEAGSKNDGGSDVVKRWSPSGFLSSIPDSLWPLSSSAPTTKEETAEFQSSGNRKHSIPEQQAPDKSKLKMLKKFPYPRWNSEALISDMTSTSGKSDASPIKPSEEKKVTTKEDISGVHHVSSSSFQQNAFSRLLANATPHNFVDFSSGLFQSTSGEGVGKVEDISQFQRQVSYSLPSPISHAILPSGSKNFFGERRGSSPESIVLDTVNLHAGLGRRFSEDSNIVKSRNHPGSKDDIRIEFKSEITLEDKKELFQNIDGK